MGMSIRMNSVTGAKEAAFPGPRGHRYQGFGDRVPGSALWTQKWPWMPLGVWTKPSKCTLELIPSDNRLHFFSFPFLIFPFNPPLVEEAKRFFKVNLRGHINWIFPLLLAVKIARDASCVEGLISMENGTFCRLPEFGAAWHLPCSINK